MLHYAGKAGRTLLFISAMCATLPVSRLTHTLLPGTLSLSIVDL
jgi:hypothetical protein